MTIVTTKKQQVSAVSSKSDCTCCALYNRVPESFCMDFCRCKNAIFVSVAPCETTIAMTNEYGRKIVTYER